MKSGKKIFREIVASPRWEDAVHALGNGDLRSLLLHITKSGKLGTETGDTIQALAMCEVTARFIKTKGKLFK